MVHMVSISSAQKNPSVKNSTPRDAASTQAHSSKIWLIGIIVLVIALMAVAMQFTQTLSGLVGGGSITTATGAQEWESGLEQLGLENVDVSTAGDTTIIAFALPQNPETLLNDKAALASMALKVNAVPDEQNLILQPEGHDTYRTTGKQAKALLQKIIESGGSLDEATLGQYVQQNPTP